MKTIHKRKKFLGRMTTWASGFSVCCASKFGVNGMTKTIASELEGEIKIYAVCPGAVDRICTG